MDPGDQIIDKAAARDAGDDEEELYDEFGNYIGPDLVENDEAGNDDDGDEGLYSSGSEYDIEHQIKLKQRQLEAEDNVDGATNQVVEEQSSEDNQDMQVVRHEDKQYYPEAAMVFGEDVEALIEEEDHQPITQPIIEPPREKFNQIFAKQVAKTAYSPEYLV